MSRRRKPQSRRITQRARVTESALDAVLNGGALDGDEHLYRPITGNRGDNLPAFQQERMQAIAKHLFRANPVGSRYIGLYTDFVLGEGATVSFRNSQVEDVVMRHWRDPYNDWERSQSDYFQHYLIFGELLVPLFPNAGDGHLRCGLQMVENIKRVNTDSENWRIVESVRMKSTTGGDEGRLYSVVNHREGREALQDTSDPALFWTRGNPFGERGMSCLYAIADLLDIMDQFVYSEIERAFLLKAFVWDVTVKGATQAEIDKKANESTPPKPGSVRWHNDGEAWQAINPRLDTYDSWNGIKALRNHTGGAMGIPEHFFSDGGDVNLATAQAMGEPVRKRLTMLQDEWKNIVTDILQAQVDYAVLAGTLPEMVEVEREGKPTGETIPARDALSVAMPDLAPDDNGEIATTLETLGRALSLAKVESLVSEETAAKVYLLNLQQTGFDLDVSEELERIEADKLARQERAQAQVEQAYDANPPTNLTTLPPRDQRREASGD